MKKSEHTISHRYARLLSVQGAHNDINFFQNRVTDHRIGVTINNVQAVMEGEILNQFVSELSESYEQEQLDSLLNITI